MQQLFTLFKSLPLPLKIGVSVVVLLLVVSIAQSVPGLLMISALIAWVLVISTLLYASGIAPALGTLPVVGPYIVALAGVAAAHMPARPAAPSGPVAAPVKPAAVKVNRAEIAERASAELRALLGGHPAVAHIADELIPHARASAREGKRLFGLNVPWLVVIHGPRGVGKSSVARALAELLIGLDVVERPVTLAIEPPPPGRADTEWGQVLERGLDAVLLLDNADWLAEKGMSSAMPVSHTVLAALINLAARGAGRVAVVVSLTSEAFDTAFGDKAKTYLNKTSYQELECVALGDEALARIFEARLADGSVRVGSGTHEEIVRFARNQRRTGDTKQFDYAEAMRRASERIIKRVKIAGRAVAEPADLRWLSNEEA
ncbi:MAG: ATP-binding protein [Zoogloeaceae bacterium]|nr:ATP-binding protein [Zoogloeaceae bacterium]